MGFNRFEGGLVGDTTSSPTTDAFSSASSLTAGRLLPGTEPVVGVPLMAMGSRLFEAETGPFVLLTGFLKKLETC